MSYFVISKSDADIVHFGIKRRSGRYPWGSGERPYQSEGGSKSATGSSDGIISAIRKKRVASGQVKLSKLKTKYDKQSESAAKSYEKAEKKSYGFFSNQEKAREYMIRASNAKYKANKTAYKAKKIYQRIMKQADKEGLTLSEDSAKIGQMFLDAIARNSDIMYSLDIDKLI